MKNHGMTITAACALGVLGAPAAAQPWEPLFDSEGFEQFPLGLMPWHYPDMLPHMIGGAGSGVPAQTPEVTFGPAGADRSILLNPYRRSPWDESSSISYQHQYERFGFQSFTFPGMPSRGGYRGLRVSFDMYHVFDADRGTVSWGIGGIGVYHEQAIAQLAWEITEQLDIRFDEWIHVSLTYDLENKLFWGSYAGEESEPVALPEKWHHLDGWGFIVQAAPYCDCPVTVPDTETVWLDNLVIEVIPPCPADCDLDYAHTFFDLLCFQDMFAHGSPRADCNLDRQLDFLDFLCFQNYFAAGCE